MTMSRASFDELDSECWLGSCLSRSAWQPICQQHCFCFRFAATDVFAVAASM